MIVRSLFNDMLIIAVFMLAGYLVRELVKPLQRLFLPASLIGGVIALVLATFGLIVAMSCGMIMVGITILMAFGLSYLFCKDQWFEKALMAYGVGTGNTATGLALVRAVDPDSLSDAPDSHGIYSAVCSWKEIFISLIPMRMVSGGAMIVVGIGGLICGVCVILGFIMFGITKKSDGGEKDQ